MVTPSFVAPRSESPRNCGTAAPDGQADGGLNAFLARLADGWSASGFAGPLPPRQFA